MQPFLPRALRGFHAVCARPARLSLSPLPQRSARVVQSQAIRPLADVLLLLRRPWLAGARSRRNQHHGNTGQRQHAAALGCDLWLRVRTSPPSHESHARIAQRARRAWATSRARAPVLPPAAAALTALGRRACWPACSPWCRPACRKRRIARSGAGGGTGALVLRDRQHACPLPLCRLSPTTAQRTRVCAGCGPLAR